MNDFVKQCRLKWTRLSAWVDARKLSERVLLFVAIAALLITATNALFLHAASARVAALNRQMIADRTAAAKLQAEIDRLAATEPTDPNLQNRARLARLTAEEAAAQAVIASLGRNLVAPGQMAAMLEAILGRHGGLQLLSLVKLPVQSLSTRPAGQPAADDGAGNAATAASDVVYKHGVEIVLQGQYLELMEYLSQLEKLPVRVVWGSLNLRVDEHPVATMSLTMFTLSLEKKWLNI